MKNSQQFDRALNTGQIGCKLCKFTEIVRPLTGNVISMDLHPIRPVKFDQAWKTGQIGCKSIEMIPNLTRQPYNVISVNLLPFWPIFHARSNCWEFFIALAENSSLPLLKILYWEFFIALAENSSLLLLKILYWEFFTASQKVGQCCDISSDASTGSK